MQRIARRHRSFEARILSDAGRACDVAVNEPAALARIAIVLVEPSHPGNVGAAARAMKVMGLATLSIVAPRFDDVLTRPDAIAFASGAIDVLESATIHPTLADALASTTHAIAMSARDREFAPPATTLRDAAADAVGRAATGGSVAFVFGSERYGLSNDDVLRCQARCRIGTSDDYASLNLAQAVQLAAYECRLAATAGIVAARRAGRARHARRARGADRALRGRAARDRLPRSRGAEEADAAVAPAVRTCRPGAGRGAVAARHREGDAADRRGRASTHRVDDAAVTASTTRP